MDRIERIESPQPHARTWAATPARDRDAQRERQEQRRQRPKPSAPRPLDDDGEPPHLVDVQA